MFKAEKIYENLMVITETHPEEKIMFCMQLVLGKTKAALIDSGLKDGEELLSLIKSLTDLPVALYLTHGHGDHSGNAHLFDEVHVHNDDGWMLNDIEYIPINDGEIIDLGETFLEAYALSGHTDGGCCFLNKNDGYALTGDIINRETWLCWGHCATPEEYAKKVLGFKQKLETEGITKIFEGHCNFAADITLCDNMMTSLTQLAKGEVKNHFYHHTEEGREKCSHCFLNSTIIYDKEAVKQ